MCASDDLLPDWMMPMPMRRICAVLHALPLLIFAPVTQGFVHGPPSVSRATQQPLIHAIPMLRRQPMLRTQSSCLCENGGYHDVEDRPQIEVAISLDDDQISAIFREFDTSKDGFIDLGELQAALGRAEGKPVSIEQAADILKLVDENDDGRISLEEFKQIFRLDAPDSLQTLARAFLDEIRDEVQKTGQFNGPILATAFTAGFLGLFWKYIVAITALYSQNDASWLPESLSLLQTVPSNFLADYQQAVILAPLLTMACTSGFAYAVGDLVAQVVEGRWRAELLDLERCARTSLLGFALHGPLVYGWIQVLEGPLATLAGGGADGAASSVGVHSFSRSFWTKPSSRH